jgi:hypothetical protein
MMMVIIITGHGCKMVTVSVEDRWEWGKERLLRGKED